MMNRTLHFFCLAILSVMLCNAQVPPLQLQNTCGSGIPSQEWNNWMNTQVEKFKLNKAAGKSQVATQIIPVIVHVIYFNETIGLYPNIDTNQIKSQIAILNKDFAGQGYNASNVPSYFSGLVANTGIQFCLAEKDKTDQPLVPHGIERVSASSYNWPNPNSVADLRALFDGTIIPSTIYPPDKYLNIWISDKPANYAPNGYATYPPASGLQGVFGGTVGTATNDGIWIYTKMFGDVGCGNCLAAAPNDKGRAATHEVGHWLGLRHIWGDGNCLSDYCGDTPTHKQAHYGCLTSTAPDLCGVNQAPNGEMPMNFMDRSDDACMYMFTPDQGLRMQTALSQSPLRYQLGTHGKCSSPVGTNTVQPYASFSSTTLQCLNAPFTPNNTSTGFPNPTFAWSSNPAASFFPNTSVSHPAITLSNPGTYTITLVATNTIASSTYSMVVSATGTCVAPSFCLDSVRMIRSVDSLKTYKAPASSVTGCGTGNWRGYMAGTNCYKDKEFAQYFTTQSYSSTPYPQVNSVIVLFDSAGTRASNPATQVTCKIYIGSVGQGPSGAIGQKSDSLGKIIASAKTPTISYLGNGTPRIGAAKVYPFKFNFASPVVVYPSNVGFFSSVEAPNSSPLDSINIMSNTVYNSAVDSSAWYFASSLTWKTFRYNRGAKIQLAMIPIVTCSSINGIEEGSLFNSNVNVMPNPNNGSFSLIFTFPQQQDLNVNIYNSLGQQISSSQITNVMNNVIDIDLSSKPDGIYFTEISNGKEKVVKKVIVNH